MKIKFLKIFSIGIAFTLISTNSGCNSSEDSGPSGTGNLRILATDDPFPYDSVTSAKINITKIEIRSSSSNYISVLEQSKSLELINLRNGLTDTLANINIPPGEYDQIRLFVESASIDLKDGRHFVLNVPSGSESGIKIFISPSLNVKSEVSTDLVLDFDISRSFVSLGNSHTLSEIKGFNFKPVIRVSNLTTSGTLAGKIMSNNGTNANANDDFALSGVLVTVSQDGSDVATAVTDDQGYYKIIGLKAGRYSLSVSAEGFVTKDIGEVEIESGNLLTEDVTLSSNSGS